MRIIGYVRTDFPSKFGIPRQSGLVEAIKGKVVFEPEFHNPEAFRGLDGFSHIWILWKFSESVHFHACAWVVFYFICQLSRQREPL